VFGNIVSRGDDDHSEAKTDRCFGSPDSRSHDVVLLRDPDPEMRRVAAEQLGKIRNPEALNKIHNFTS
jgi:hypothetical protein